jgi:acylphosphatase
VSEPGAPVEPVGSDQPLGRLGRLERRRVVVHGQVQGVWFRDSCRAEAVQRGVAGWVRNRADGSVEAVFEGSPDAVSALVAWCRTGPPRARVERVDIADELPEGLSGFSVR